MAGRRPLGLRTWLAGAAPRTSADSSATPRTSLARHRVLRWAGWLAPPAVLAAVILPLAFTVPQGVNQVGSYLPQAALYLSYSFARMVAAYALSVGFALAYGYYAATHRTGERILLPVLDILQSIPILAFFPFVLLLFVTYIPAPAGANLAAIFLIFTSMSWNLAFGVYESIKGIPGDLREATNSFGVTGRQRWRELFLPATVNRLVYNSVLSWTAGWFFLVSSEIISTGSGSTTLPGIGSFLAVAASVSNLNALVAGMVLLGLLIVVLDLLVWRPAGRVAERYRYDTTPSADEAVTSRRPRVEVVGRAVRLVTRGVSRGARGGYAILRAPFEGIASYARGPTPHPKARPRLRAATYYIALGAGLVAIWLLFIFIIIGAYNVFTGPSESWVSQAIASIPAALGSSLARLLIAYTLCLAIAIPLAIYLARNRRANRYGLPVVEVTASFPATAFFPLLVVGLVPVIGAEATSILMLMTGMIWYLFFNLLSGVRGIPPDLEEASRSLGTSRRVYYRLVLLPAIIPALITGSITAFGGGWNTLIVAEYLGNPVDPSMPLFHVLGIGSLIDFGNFNSGACLPTSISGTCGGFPLMVAALLTMVIVVIIVNEVVWKPLYRRSVERYHYD